MPSETDPERRQPLAIRLAIALMVLVALSGIAMIGNGLYMMARAEFSKVSQSSSTEHHLAQVRDTDGASLESVTDS